MREKIFRWEKRALSGEGLGFEDAMEVLEVTFDWLYDLLGATWRVRKRFKGEFARFCSIVNAKSGICSEDCSFCSQSRVSRAKIEKYPLMGPEEIVKYAHAARESGARNFSVVTSGVGLKNGREVEKIGEAISKVRKVGLETCVSVGIVDRETIRHLKSKGLMGFHHNLETSRSFFPNICTTHSYEDDVEAVRAAKEQGLWVCCGGIFGIGESNEDRVELALTLKELEVDSIPINFLNPIPGTPLEGKSHLTPVDCLKIIAMMRLVNPTREIIVCGGREVNLRDLQSLMFAAGATGTMLGNYLTTAGRPPEEDLRMVEDLNLRRTVETRQ